MSHYCFVILRTDQHTIRAMPIGHHVDDPGKLNVKYKRQWVHDSVISFYCAIYDGVQIQ